MCPPGAVILVLLVLRPPGAADLAAEYEARSTKDAVPQSMVAARLCPLVASVHAMGKVCHLLCTGCNTIGVVRHLKEQIPLEHQSIVYVLCTTDVWPGDLSTTLWGQYGGCLQPDLVKFRNATRYILDEYTHHYKRQRIVDQSMKEGARRHFRTLSDCVHLDCLANVKATDFGDVIMQKL